MRCTHPGRAVYTRTEPRRPARNREGLATVLKVHTDPTYSTYSHLNALTAESPLTEAERKVFYTIGQEGLKPREQSNTLQQYNMLLRILDKPQMNVGAAPYQATNLVRVLRNMLIHPIPGRVVTFVEGNDLDGVPQQDIVKKLKNHLDLGPNATFPADVITKECAAWAVGSCEAFLHAFVLASGIDPGFLTDPKHVGTAK